MKVVVVGTGGALVSGISTATDGAAELLVAMGHDVERVTAGAAPRARPNRLNAENVRAVLGDAAAVRRRVRATGADVVWVHTFGLPLLPAVRALLLVLAARLGGARAIVSFHAFGFEGWMEAGGRPLRMVLWLLGRVAAGLTVLYDDAGALLNQATGRPAVVLPNWVDVPPVVPPMPAGPPWRLVFVGGVVARKGVPELLAAMRLLADDSVELRIVGGAGEDGEEALVATMADAADLVEQGRVTFVGELGSEDVRRELGGAHVLVLPSHREGTPMALLEAMAMGRPAVVSEAGNMGQVVRGSGAGIVLEEVEPAIIGDAVRHLLRRPDELVTIGGRAHDHARRLHSSLASEPAVAELMEVAP